MTLAERLLRLVLDGEKAAALVGDLEEEARRAKAGGAWMRRQVLRCALAAAALSIRRRRRRMFTTAALALRDARRSIWRFRGASALAALILTLSIAAGAVAFAVVDAIVLRPLPYHESNRLVSLFGATPASPRNMVVSPADY